MENHNNLPPCRRSAESCDLRPPFAAPKLVLFPTYVEKILWLRLSFVELALVASEASALTCSDASEQPNNAVINAYVGPLFVQTTGPRSTFQGTRRSATVRTTDEAVGSLPPGTNTTCLGRVRKSESQK